MDYFCFYSVFFLKIIFIFLWSGLFQNSKVPIIKEELIRYIIIESYVRVSCLMNVIEGNIEVKAASVKR